MNEEGNSHRILNLVLVRLCSLTPSLLLSCVLEKPPLLSYTFCAGAVIRQVGAGGNPELQNSGCQNQSWKKPKQHKSSLPWSRCQVTPKTSDSFMLKFWDSGNPSSGLSEEGLQLSRTYNTLHSACLPLPESRSLCPGDWGSPSGAVASCRISAPYS